jgi:signal transduction histidine kinase
VELDRIAATPVNLVQVVVGARGLVDPPDEAVIAFIRSTFANQKPDLVMTIAGPAAQFARKYRPSLFPDTPLLLAAVDRQVVGAAPLRADEAAVMVAQDFSQRIADILALEPQTSQVFMVVGARETAKFWHVELERQFKRFEGRLTFVWSDDMSLQEIVRRCASLPRDAAIFYLSFGTDGSGATYTDEQVLNRIHTTASAPLFGLQGAYIGHGVVGGFVVPVDVVSRNTADAVVRLLDGATPASIVVPPQLSDRPIYDWRELDRWSIPESRLPPGSTVLYRPQSLWDQYRTSVLFAFAVLFIQSLLIAGLLYQRRARQRAELDSRKNLALAADANRRQTMSALTSSIAHEVGQPLSAMIHNAQALQMMVTAGKVTPETTGEILSDIRAQGLRATEIIERHRTMLRSRQLNKQPLDVHAVINESLALVAHDLEARRIETSINLASIPCVVSGDQVLLQQVLVNLVMNAIDSIDAKAGTAPARRQVAIVTDVNDAHVDISVSDTGVGLPEQLDGTLFTPFVTTKSKGLGIGLTIAKTIVEGHGGTIAARNNADGGATFSIKLPCEATAAAGVQR